MHIVRRLIAFLLLAWLPLQAVAAPALALSCEREHGAPSGHVAMHADHHAAGVHQDGNAPDVDHRDQGDGVGHAYAGEACCHLVASATPPALPLPPALFGAAALAAPVVHPYYIFPEQPQRPPLAAL